MMSPAGCDNNKKVCRLMVLYNILLFMVIAVGFPFIVPAIAMSKKRRGTVLQRLGLVSMPAEIRQGKKRSWRQKPIWIHALSVGEVLSAVPLIKETSMRFGNRKIFVSVSTATGFQIAVRQIGNIADAVFYYPYDLAFAVKYVTAKVDPAFVVIVESDIWPNFLFEMQHRHIPVILVNARMSQRSFRGYRCFGFFSKYLFLSFAHICTQSIKDAKRFIALGVPPDRITVAGNIKFEQKYNPGSKEEIENLQQRLQVHTSQKILLAGSTHKGEEEIILRAFSRMKKKYDELLLIVVPRDPERAGSVRRLFQSAGHAAVLLTALDRAGSDGQYNVLVVDIIGVLKNLYALADVAFVGGSLVNCGGHNPLEPAVFCKPILFGYDMSDFAEISNLLVTAGGAKCVQDAESLYHAASELLEDYQKATKMGQNAFKVFVDNKGAVDKTLKVILDQVDDRVANDG